MMNKISTRVFAWLLAVVMILNIAPVTALADYSPVAGPPPLGIASNVTVTYEGSGTWNGAQVRTGADKTPSTNDFYFGDQYNYGLVGWSTVQNDDGTRGVIFRPGSYLDLNAAGAGDSTSITLYAVSGIKVSFEPQGHMNSPKSVFVLQGTSVSKPQNDPQPSDSYNNGAFECWLLNGQPYDFSTPVRNAITLTAKYAPRQQEAVNSNITTNYKGPYTIVYAFNEKYNYFADEDIEIKPATAENGDPKDNIWKQIEQSYVSASNDNIPYIMTVSG